MVTLGRTALEGKRGCILCPVAAPVEDIVVWKKMPCFLVRDWDWLNTWVVPRERPELFRIDLVKALEPVGHAGGFPILKTLRQAIQQIVIRMKASAGMAAWILFAPAGARQGPFEDVAEIKYIPTRW